MLVYQRVVEHGNKLVPINFFELYFDPGTPNAQ